MRATGSGRPSAWWGVLLLALPTPAIAGWGLTVTVTCTVEGYSASSGAIPIQGLPTRIDCDAVRNQILSAIASAQYCSGSYVSPCSGFDDPGLTSSLDSTGSSFSAPSKARETEAWAGEFEERLKTVFNVDTGGKKPEEIVAAVATEAASWEEKGEEELFEELGGDGFVGVAEGSGPSTDLSSSGDCSGVLASVSQNTDAVGNEIIDAATEEAANQTSDAVDGLLWDAADSAVEGAKMVKDNLLDPADEGKKNAECIEKQKKDAAACDREPDLFAANECVNRANRDYFTCIGDTQAEKASEGMFGDAGKRAYGAGKVVYSAADKAYNSFASGATQAANCLGR